MGPFKLSYAACLLACLPQAALAAASSSAPMLDLRAATRRSDTLRRNDKIRTSQSVDLLYADADNSGSQNSVFFSRVQAQSSKQVLLLEDIEDQLNLLECTNSGIELGFRDAQVFADAEVAISGVEGGYVVASHAGCNDEGSRAVFLVEGIDASEDTNTITLSTVKKPWKEAFGHFAIDYGYSQDHHELRRHQQQRRQAATTQAPEASAAASTTSAAVSRTSFLPAKNASVATLSSVALNLDYEEANTTFTMPPGVTFTAPFTLGCRECKTTGQLNLTQGGWEFDWPDMDEITEMDSVADIFKAGWVQLAISNFSAYIELQSSPAESGSLVLPLFTARTLGFKIPELGTAGIMFEPALTFNWALSGGIRMSYGFDLELPNAVASLNFTDLESSFVTGLENYSLKALPFQANISDIDLQLSVALRPRIELAFGLFDDELLAEAGTYLDLPIATANITQLASANVDENCNPVSADTSSSSAGNDDDDSAIQTDFDGNFANLTHISAQVDIGAGVDLRMQADLPVLKDPVFATSWSIASMPATSLPTACLVYQTDAPANAAFTPAATKMAAMKKEKEAKEGGGLLGGGGGVPAQPTPAAGAIFTPV